MDKPGKSTESKNLDLLFKKIKKRQLKKQIGEGTSTQTIDETNEPNDTSDVENSASENFTTIGDEDFGKTKKLKTPLPKWLEQPELIPTDIPSGSENVFPNFKPQILSNLKENNITRLFPVQRVVIPWIMEQTQKCSLSGNYVPRDVCVSSPTGSGKTLAYVLPIVEDLIGRLVPRIRCMVVVPVQELADQVAKVFESFIKGTNLRVEAITGGNTNLEVERNRILKEIKGHDDSYESLVDILVVTPGRLVEHLEKTKGFNLKHLKYLVVDEADKMMDGIQNDWLFYLAKHLGQELFPTLSLSYVKKRGIGFQKLLFSATLSYDPDKLLKLNLFQPKLFTSQGNGESATITQQNNTSMVAFDRLANFQEMQKFLMPRQVEELYVVVKSSLKPVMIVELLLTYKWKKVLCFCKSSSEASRLSALLKLLCSYIKVKDISANLDNTTRKSVLKQFVNGKIDMLVSSDVMARGIDIPKVEYVISYDAPKDMCGYVHRAGRTGRCGEKGTVVTFIPPEKIISFTHEMHACGVNVNELEINIESVDEKENDLKQAIKKLRNSVEDEVRQFLHITKPRESTKRKKKSKLH